MKNLKTSSDSVGGTPSDRNQTFKNSWAFTFIPGVHSSETVGPSLTVPDQSYSIREILEKFSRGIDPYLTKLPSYDEDDIDVEDDVTPDRLPDHDLSDLDLAAAYVDEVAQIHASNRATDKQKEQVPAP